MCSCSRDGKPHTDACRAAHSRYNGSLRGYIRNTHQSMERKRERAEAAATKLGIEVPWQTN